MNSQSSKEQNNVFIINPKTNEKYHKLNFLGKGGFAKCYEYKNTNNGEVFAGKVIPKSILVKPDYKEKVFQEIHIQSTLSHNHIVSLHSYFEDENNVYIILELCRKRSLMEMHKRRKMLTLPETRYFVQQVALACKYMHDNKVIHRDLKLGNLFISDDMTIKIGDFGLSTRLSFDGERKKTVCGTPNYIAPEILTKKGHSYEVDMWSLGCIIYTLLVGNPPFQAHTVKETYNKIKKCDYFLPANLDTSARGLIKKLLHADPQRRLTVDAVLESSFFHAYIPSCLPVSCLTMRPRLSHNISLCEESRNERKPLAESGNVTKPVTTKNIASKDAKLNVKKQESICKLLDAMPEDFYLSDLFEMLSSVVRVNPETLYTGHPEDAQDPSAVPFVWISKWVDYTDKYGIGYQLCDDSFAVLFNDGTHLAMFANGNLQYTKDACHEYYSMENYPVDLEKKITLLNYFSTYMSENLVKAGESARPRECDAMTQMPYLHFWFRTKHAIVFHLTNGTVQVNFFTDHTKVIICPLMGAASFIDENKNFTVYSFQLIEKYGCSSLFASKLRYVKHMVDRLCKHHQKSTVLVTTGK